MLLLFSFPPGPCTTAAPEIKTQQYEISFLSSNESCSWVSVSPWALIRIQPHSHIATLNNFGGKFVNLFFVYA